MTRSVEPLTEGGGQEQGLRSGTSDVAGAVAMAAALDATAASRDVDGARIHYLAWGEPGQARTALWPIYMRAGRRRSEDRARTP